MFFLVFSLIRDAVRLVLLPFRLVWEMAAPGHRGHHGRRRRVLVHRGVPSARRRSFTPGSPRPAGPWPWHWQSLPPGRKALIIAIPLALVLLIAAGAVLVSPGPAHSPAAQAAGIAEAQVSGPALARHHRSRHHREHRYPVAPPSTAPTPAACHPTAASGACYEPGELCPHADAGMTGLAGDGKKIICEKDHGLRWEPL